MLEDRIQELNHRKISLECRLSDLMERRKDVNSAQTLADIELQIEKTQNELSTCVAELSAITNNSSKSVIDKFLCFSNIRELLKGTDVKIGQIEKEAGCQPGYMSRLDKQGNYTEPSASFLFTAAKMLNISLDVLLTIDVAELTPTEKYLLKMLDKLKDDTLKDKLEWVTHSPDEYNHMECDMNGNVDHPLFSYETFNVPGETEYPEEVSGVVFCSKAFGFNTSIFGECYSLKLKNNSTLYLMDVVKACGKINDKNRYAKEIWMHVPGNGIQFLISNHDKGPLGKEVDGLFAILNESMNHPKIKKNFKSVLDSFMNDDFSNDSGDDLPF